jgi:hypothetical protein
MNKTFRSYEELINEKQQLEALLHAQKELLHSDIREIKAEFLPIIDTVKKFTTKDKTSAILNFGSDLLVNGVVKNFVLARAGFIARIVIPYLLKNYSSHLVADNKSKWFHKIASWLGHKNGKDHKGEHQGEKDQAS